MKMHELITRISKLQPTEDLGSMVVPPPELIAFNVRMTRRLMNLKKSALGHMAGVSLSTIERVENAENVGAESLDKIAVAFGEQPGYFTAPRALQSQEDGAAKLYEKFGELTAVSVRHLTKQTQIRELVSCQAFMVNAPDLDNLKEEIAGLVEWLDLGAFLFGPHAPPSKLEKGGRRELYTDILGAVTSLERQGVTVLAGVLSLPQHGVADWKTGILNITRKESDPGAINRKCILVDLRCFSNAGREAWNSL